MDATHRRPQRRNPDSRLSRFTHRHTPFQPPRFGVWHGLLATALTLTFAAQLAIPGVLGDIGGIVVGDWKAGIIARVTVLGLFAYAMIFVRTLHPLAYAAMIVTSGSLCLRLGDIRITHEPLTLPFALALFAFALFAMRAITRQPDPVYRRGE
jgi:hypothetical protein